MGEPVTIQGADYDAPMRAHLRDQFACAAMQGLIAGESRSPTQERQRAIAASAYAIADAMLRERDQQPKPAPASPPTGPHWPEGGG